jgi:hypothetical protein
MAFCVDTSGNSDGCTWGMIVILFNEERSKMAYGWRNFRPRHDDVIVPGTARSGLLAVVRMTN